LSLYLDWTREEVKLIVEDYFKMLQLEIDHKGYNKTEHRKSLIPHLQNRNDGSVEFKHQNISAVLINMGLPFIKGYKPRFSYQQLLEKEIGEYLERNKNILEGEFERFSENTEIVIPKKKKTDYSHLLTEEPILSTVSEREPLYRPFKTNFLEKEQNNRKLGEAGEQFVIEYEKWRLTEAGTGNYADRIEWVSKEQGDGIGYDILSRNTNGTDRYIEVKTTKLSKETPIYLTKNEISFASSVENNFYLYRLFNFDVSPGIFIKNGDYNKNCALVPETFKGYFLR
jgi:hypothetical protein